MLCPSCHTQNRDNAKFCKNCGMPFSAEHGETGQSQEAVVQPQMPAESAEAPVATALPSTNAAQTNTNAGEEDISLAPTLILNPQEMIAHQTRRWQQEQELAQNQPSAAATTDNQSATDIADLPTMQITPSLEAQRVAPNEPGAPSTLPSHIETQAIAPNEAPAAANEHGEVSSATPDEAAASSTASHDVPASSTNDHAGGQQPPVDNVGAQSIASTEGQPATDQNSQHNQPDGAFPVLAAGTMVIGRYEITQVLSEDEQEHVYQVIDRQGYLRCWNCGSEQNTEGDEFCIDCGAELLNVAYIMHEYPPAQTRSDESHVLSGAILNTFIDSGKTYIIEQPQVSQSTFPDGVHLLVASDSDAGNVRRSEPNEDSTLVLQLQRVHESISASSGVFIVADGLGGHDNGQVASRMTVNIIAEHMVRELLARPLTAEKIGEQLTAMNEDDLVALLKGAVEEANTVLCQVNSRDKTDMGSTLTGFMMVGDHAYIVNVGDSRTYMLRDGKLYQLTNDHSLVGQLVAGGLIEPDDVYTHPQRSQIFRSLGDKLNVQIDIFKQQVHPGDTLLSCSDGLWEMVRNPQITEILMNATDPQMACGNLIDAANANGGEDNVSAVVVFVRS